MDLIAIIRSQLPTGATPTEVEVTYRLPNGLIGLLRLEVDDSDDEPDPGEERPLPRPSAPILALVR